MAIFNKLVPQKTPAIFKSATYKNVLPSSKTATADAAPAPASAPAPINEFVPSPEEQEQKQFEAFATVYANYDIPTYFTTFMVIYFGLFGIVLLLYPYAFAADGLPFANPLAYWTTITPEMAFIFRIAGGSFLCLSLGPFLDELTGFEGTPVGVSMSAFTLQMCLANGLTFFIFVYYTFWAPLETAVALVWTGQTFIAAFLFGWSLNEVSGSKLVSYYTIFTTLYFGGFSLALLSVPNLLFGPPSPFKYWESWPNIAIMTARFLGAAILCVVIGGYFLYSKTNINGFAKMCTLFNVLFFILFFVPAFFGQGSAVANMWEIQLAAQVPIVVVGLYLELSGATGSWKLCPDGMCPRACGANCETFNLIAFVWYLMFVPVMFTKPNMFLGPEPITVLPMIMEPFGETSDFFGKSWAIAVLILILGPYVFGFSHDDVAKQTTASFFLFAVNFGASFYFYPTLLNPITMGPLAGTNVLLFAFGLYTVRGSFLGSGGYTMT